MTTVEVGTPREQLIEMVDELIFEAGDEAFHRVADSIGENDLLADLWRDLGHDFVSYTWRKSNSRRRVEMPELLRPNNTGERIVDMKAIRHESELYMVAYKVDGVWRRFRELTKSDAAWIADDYERRRDEMGALGSAFRRIEAKLEGGKTIGVQFPTAMKLREVLTPEMATMLGMKE